LKKLEEYRRNAAELREMAVGASSARHRQRLQEMAEIWERFAELEKRHLTAENNNVIELVLPPNDPKRNSNKVFPQKN
jgi:hypothetical protein